MITPLDIQSKEFKKTLNGYKSKDVDEFLDNINDDYERLYRENIELKDKIGILTDQIRQYNNLEETLKSTLVMAQSTADDVTSSARKKAELIIEDAEIHAKNLINDAQDHVKEINREYDYLKKEMFIFKTRYQSFIQAQLISLEEFYRDYEDKEIEMLIETEEIEQNNIEENNIEESNIEENSVEDIDNLGA